MSISNKWARCPLDKKIIIILDLFLTNTPSLVQNTETLPSLGTSDHDIVFHEVHIKIGRPFQPKRPIGCIGGQTGTILKQIYQSLEIRL